MGYYIQVPDNKGKAQQLVNLHAADLLPMRPEGFEDVPEDKALICVVDNGPFEAAGLVIDREDFIDKITEDEPGPDGELGVGPGGIPVYTIRSEYQEQGEQRPRWWLLMDKALTYELAGYTP